MKRKQLTSQLAGFLTFQLVVLVFHKRVLAGLGQPPQRCPICSCPLYGRGEASVFAQHGAASSAGKLGNRCSDQRAPCQPLSLPCCQGGPLQWLPLRECDLLALSLPKCFNFFKPYLIFYCFLWMKGENLVLKNT